MKTVRWVDDCGFAHISLIRDEDAEDAAVHGIPIGPNLRYQIDLGEFVKDLQSELVDRGILTWDDVERTSGSNALIGLITLVAKRHVSRAMRQS